MIYLRLPVCDCKVNSIGKQTTSVFQIDTHCTWYQDIERIILGLAIDGSLDMMFVNSLYEPLRLCEFGAS